MTESLNFSSPLADLHATAGTRPGRLDGRVVPASFGDTAAEIAAARAGAAVFDLSHLDIAWITGDDSRRFTNGMFTNNVRDLRPGSHNRHAMAEPKGRMLALLDVYCLEESAFVAVLEGRDFAWFFERLDRYIIMDDVEITDRSADWKLLSVQGPGAVAAVAAVDAPEAALRWPRDRTGLGGVDLLVPADRVAETWRALIAAGVAAGGNDALEALRVRAGKPRWPVDMSERSFPHEMLLDKEACGFRKGCYLGQEIINRMDTIGRPTKKLSGIRVTSDIDLSGAELFVAGARAASVTSAARIDGQSLGLAVLRLKVIEGGAVTVRVGGTEIEGEVIPLPFPDA